MEKGMIFLKIHLHFILPIQYQKKKMYDFINKPTATYITKSERYSGQESVDCSQKCTWSTLKRKVSLVTFSWLVTPLPDIMVPKTKHFFFWNSPWLTIRTMKDRRHTSFNLLARLPVNLKSSSQNTLCCQMLLLRIFLFFFFNLKFQICTKRKRKTTTRFKHREKAKLFFWPFTHAN